MARSSFYTLTIGHDNKNAHTHTHTHTHTHAHAHTHTLTLSLLSPSVSLDSSTSTPSSQLLSRQTHLGIEENATCEHLIDHYTQGPEIHLVPIVFVVHNLRSKVVGCTAEGAGRRREGR